MTLPSLKIVFSHSMASACDLMLTSGAISFSSVTERTISPISLPYSFIYASQSSSGSVKTSFILSEDI